MKKSIMLAIAILALGAAPGFFQANRLAGLREDHRKLVLVAVNLGIAPGDSTLGSEPRLTKRQRDDQAKQSLSIGSAVIAFAREMESIEQSGGTPDPDLQKRAMETMARLMELDPSELAQVIARLRESKEISSETRGNIIAFSIMSLSNDHPEAAVALFAESSDLLDQNMLGDHVISSALSRWAELNPSAALDWIKKNSEAHPEIASDEAKAGVIAGAATTDPRLAFKLMSEMKFEHSMSAINAIIMTGHENPEQRNAVLSALREHVAGVPNEAEREEIQSKALEMFARTADSEGFDSLSKWMDSSKFTPTEKEQFAGGLTYFTTKQETGRWVEWMSGNLPAGSLSDPVREVVGEWTQQDYVSAGQWLSTSSDGPAKTAAVEAYAAAVAEYEPQVAAQWTMTLPPGPGRDSTLKSVHENWPASDPEGATAFAREHGLE